MTATETAASTDTAASSDLERLEAKVDALTARLDVLVDDATRRAAQRSVLDEFVADVAPLGPDALGLVTERLAEAERRGYFDVARAGAGVVDRVVTTFGEDDVEQLGDNIVAILETVKELTQPEMLDLLRHMLDGVRRQQVALEAETDEAPGLLALAGQLREPEVRRGIGRALATLRAVSEETTVVGPSTPPSHRGEQ